MKNSTLGSGPLQPQTALQLQNLNQLFSTKNSYQSNTQYTESSSNSNKSSSQPFPGSYSTQQIQLALGKGVVSGLPTTASNNPIINSTNQNLQLSSHLNLKSQENHVNKRFDHVGNIEDQFISRGSDRIVVGSSGGSVSSNLNQDFQGNSGNILHHHLNDSGMANNPSSTQGTTALGLLARNTREDENMSGSTDTTPLTRLSVTDHSQAHVAASSFPNLIISSNATSCNNYGVVPRSFNNYSVQYNQSSSSVGPTSNTTATIYQPQQSVTESIMKPVMAQSSSPNEPLTLSTDTLSNKRVPFSLFDPLSSKVLNCDMPYNSNTALPAAPTFRMLIYIDEPQNHYQLVAHDIQFLLSCYGSIQLPVVIIPDRPAAEVNFRSFQALTEARNDLHNLLLLGIGILKCVPIPPGQTVEQYLSTPALSNIGGSPSMNGTENKVVSTPHQQQPLLPSLSIVNDFISLLSTQQQSQNEDPTVIAPQQLASMEQSQLALASAMEFPIPRTPLAQPQPLAQIEPITQLSHQQRESDASAVTPASAQQPLNLSNSNETVVPPPIAKPKNLCRLELIDLFGHHPHFDVTKAILGPNNSNIRYILDVTDNKVNLDIKGKLSNSAPVAERLHVVISSDDYEVYLEAITLSEDLLTSVCQQYAEYCAFHRYELPPTMGFKRHEYEENEETKLWVYKGCKERNRSWWGTRTRGSKREKRNDRRNDRRGERIRVDDTEWTGEKRIGRRGRGGRIGGRSGT